MSKQSFGSYVQKHKYSMVILVAICLLAGFWFLNQEQALRQKRLELESMKMEQAELEQAIALLEADNSHKDDQDLRESLARKKLNMIKPDEIIYIIKFNNKGE